MLSISFDFDENTQKVSNLKVTSNTKATTISTINKYDVELQDNKLVFTSEALDKLNASTGDRISVNYWNESPTVTYPIISKSEIFTDGSDGNKCTKARTVSFRGQQRATLLKFGSVFSFEEFIDKAGNIKEGVFKLVPVKEDDADSDITEEKEILENMDQSKIEDDLAEMLNQEDTYNDLPF